MQQLSTICCICCITDPPIEALFSIVPLFEVSVGMILHHFVKCHYVKVLIFRIAFKLLLLYLASCQRATDTPDSLEAFVIQFAISDSIFPDELPNIVISPIDDRVHNCFSLLNAEIDNLSTFVIVVVQEDARFLF